MASRFTRTKKDADELSQLRNIGKAMRKDFELLGIKSVKQLARCNADQLYAQIQTLTESRHDPCVWDTYAAAIHQAKTGEALPWWEFTKVRKERELFIPLSRSSRLSGGLSSGSRSRRSNSLSRMGERVGERVSSRKHAPRSLSLPSPTTGEGKNARGAGSSVSDRKPAAGRR